MGVCGAVKKDEPLVSRAEPEIDYVHTSSADQKPGEIAQVAKNMSAPKPPTDSELRAQYEQMGDAGLEKEVNALQTRLAGGIEYAGAELDRRKLPIAEAVATERSNKANPELERTPPKPSQDEAFVTRSVLHVGKKDGRLGVEAEAALHKTDNVTVLEAGVQVSTDQIGPHATVLHGQRTWSGKGVDFTLSGDAGTVEYGPGIHNADGSTGLHVGGNATEVGVEGTLHKEGVGSLTGGVGAGLSAEASVGLKKEGKTVEACGRVSWTFFTVGACFPVWSSRN